MSKESKSKKEVTKKAASKSAIKKPDAGTNVCFLCTKRYTKHCLFKDQPSVAERGVSDCSGFSTDAVQELPCGSLTKCDDANCEECAKASTAKPEAITPEVMPKDEALALPCEATQIVKYQADAPVLTSIESSIKRDIQLAGKLDKAGAMIAIKIGLALDMAKRMIGHGFYEAWMKAKFGDIFSARRGQYYLKLAQKFQQTEWYRHLELPEKSEMGNYLAVSDESSDLGNAVASFVGDLSINELMDKHGVKSKLPGGWHPADRDMEAFVRDYPELRGKPFDTWADADKEKFKTWMTNQQAGDMEFAKKLNAEGFWSKLTIDIMNKGLQEKTWGVIDNKMLTDLHHALGTLHREIGKAIKTSEEK